MNGQESFICVRAVSSDEDTEDKGNFPVRFRREENYSEWKPALTGERKLVLITIFDRKTFCVITVKPVLRGHPRGIVYAT